MSQAKTTQDHGTIRQWAEERGGRPAAVGETRSEEDPGILRLDFEPKDEGLDPLSWDEFFQKFDSAHLTFLYQDEIGIAALLVVALAVTGLIAVGHGALSM